MEELIIKIHEYKKKNVTQRIVQDLASQSQYIWSLVHFSAKVSYWPTFPLASSRRFWVRAALQGQASSTPTPKLSIHHQSSTTSSAARDSRPIKSRRQLPRYRLSAADSSRLIVDTFYLLRLGRRFRARQLRLIHHGARPE
jgi:hypothetical protein